VTELNLSGEERLYGCRAAADVDQTGVEAVLLENFLFVGQPQRTDVG
jgi:hypothetical protein